MADYIEVIFQQNKNNVFPRRKKMDISSDLPGDIMVDILLRLPVKSLVQFRCVCKSWHTLIKHSDFVTMHLKKQSSSSHLIIQRHKNIRRSSGDDKILYCHAILKEEGNLFSSYSGNFLLVDSFNGLLCLFGPMDSQLKRNIYLWNPSVRKYKVLPNCDFQDRSTTPHLVLGFGFLPQINEFKVVKMMVYSSKDDNAPESDPPKVEVYSLSRNSWKKIKNSFKFCVGCTSSHAFVNEAVHWTANIPLEKGSGFDEFILAFDMANEVFRKIKLPDRGLEYGALTLSPPAVFKESYLLHVDYPGKTWEVDCLDIWVMKEYGVEDSWTKLFTIKPSISHALDFMKNGEVVMLGEAGELVLYDSDDPQYKGLGFYGDAFTLRVLTYMGSLILLNEADDVANNQPFSFSDGVILPRR